MNQPVTLIRTAFIGVAFLFCQAVTAQTASHLEDDFDLLTSEWLSVSGDLKTYQGLNRFCQSAQYRQDVVDVLDLMHHYDSLVLNVLLDPSYDLQISHREYKNTVKDIQQFEENYSIKKFMDFLRQSCRARNDLEKNKADLMKGSGVHSYDGKILVLENELRKFLKNIDKKVIAIDDHLHLIHVDQVEPYMPVTEDH